MVRAVTEEKETKETESEEKETEKKESVERRSRCAKRMVKVEKSRNTVFFPLFCDVLWLKSAKMHVAWRSTRDIPNRHVRRSGEFPHRAGILEHQIVRFPKIILHDVCSTLYFV